MKLREMSKEHIDALCNHFLYKYAGYQDDKSWGSYYAACKHCPFSIMDSYGTYDCAASAVTNDTDYSLEKLMED